MCFLFLCAGLSAPAAGGIRINEVMVRPAGGAGEWIELINVGTQPFDLEGWTVADGTGRARRIGEALVVEPGALVVLASRPDSLRAAFAVPPTVPVARPDGWPVLNDRDAGPGEPADVVVLRRANGALAESLAYYERWLPPHAGQSLERVDTSRRGADPGGWGWSLAPAGATPGQTNSLTATPGGETAHLDGPRRVHPARHSAVYSYRFPGPGTLAIWLVDRGGAVVAVMQPPEVVGAVGQWVWGSSAPTVSPAGPYLLCVRWQGEGGLIRRCLPVWVR